MSTDPKIHSSNRESRSRRAESRVAPPRDDIRDIDPRRARIIARWLGICAAMVFGMVVLGGLTRLTHSGLSMVDWQPVHGILPPMSREAWQALFDAYRETPEFRHVNPDMDLEGFKSIFWLEYIHRVFGRLLGLVFAVPLAVFAVRGWLTRRLLVCLLGVLALGGAQALMGWYMVESGLVDRPDVSHYRLAAHLALAVVLLGWLVWLSRSLSCADAAVPSGGGRGGSPRSRSGPARGQKSVRAPRHDRADPDTLVRGLAWALVLWTFLTIVWGAFVAGLDAGLIYNTWPLMGGGLAPAELGATSPGWLDVVENPATVQFVHRLLGQGLVVASGAVWLVARRRLPRGHRGRTMAGALVLASLGQLGLGVATLLAAVPVSLGVLHQAGAMVVLVCAVALAHSLRRGASWGA